MPNSTRRSFLKKVGIGAAVAGLTLGWMQLVPTIESVGDLLVAGSEAVGSLRVPTMCAIPTSTDSR